GQGHGHRPAGSNPPHPNLIDRRQPTADLRRFARSPVCYDRRVREDVDEDADGAMKVDVAHPGRWWRPDEGGKILCELCPRACRLGEGQRAFCFVRMNQGGQMVLTPWGRSSGFCVDPIEKKPLNHFLPGTSVLSFGTAGCNLGCKFCQNWDISKAKEIDTLADAASPTRLAEVAEDLGCASVAFTYNDPVIFLE